jgi:hypothetical protein
MITLSINGITWEVNGKKDGKGIFLYEGCTVSYCKTMGVFQFKQGDNLILARECRADCLRDATHVILDSYANQFVPCWEYPSDGTAQEAA